LVSVNPLLFFKRKGEIVNGGKNNYAQIRLTWKKELLTNGWLKKGIRLRRVTLF
jgi:hypothetical protein